MASVAGTLQSVDYGELIYNMASGIANSQLLLDQTSIEIAQAMSVADVEFLENTYSLLELGFTPQFYKFTATTIDIKMAVSMSRQTDIHLGVKAKGGNKVWGVSIDASYTGSYGFSADGSSSVNTVLNPIPLPAAMQTAIDAKLNPTTP